MSVKYIHVILIVVSILLAIGFGLWAFLHDYAPWAGVSMLMAVGLAVYCVQFVKKMKVL